jgi:UDP-2,3-diacylglucosamine pyrophosphatase LpxH
MGFRFPIEAGNIVAYLTAPNDPPPPRLTKFELQQYFTAIVMAPHRFISSRRERIDQIIRAADVASGRLLHTPGESDRLLSSDETESLLSDFKYLLGDYELFGLIVDRFGQSDELQAFAKHAAYASGGHALILYPEFGSGDISLLDPFPFIAQILEQPQNWPGVLFWTRAGISAFAPLRDAARLFAEIVLVLDTDTRAVGAVLDGYHQHPSSRRVLHLSDLHFGTEHALENEAYLSRHLDTLAERIDRTVITGDLFNNPRRQDALAFRNFRDALSVRTGKEVIVIPGNHDQKWLGNVGSPLREVAKLEWSSYVPDDDLGCNFLCFDSSRDADLARGKVTRQQLMDTATEFEKQCALKPGRRQYLSIALIHHHPFSFESKQETRVQRVLAWVGLNDERFLRMEDADGFLGWCAARNVPLILHGHKHVQRHVQNYVNYGDEAAGGHWRTITAVGCGTSLGAGGMALSYNILTWDPDSRHWGVSFYADPGDGSGFTRQMVTLHEVQ